MISIRLAAPSKRNQWATTALVVLLFNPIFLYAWSPPPKLPSIFDTVFILTTFSILYVIGFLTGPVGLLASAYYFIDKIRNGLTEYEIEFFSCLTKDRFEAGLVNLFPTLVLPASAVSTFILVNRFVLKRTTKPWHVTVVFVTCTVLADSGLWYVEALQREASLAPC